MARSVLLYLKEQLQFKAREWAELPEKDREILKGWAKKEMEVFGIEHD